MALDDPHFNLFYAYRGPAGSKADRLNQLEDNLTRALCITLRELGSGTARDSLLKILGVQGHAGHDVAIELQPGAPREAWGDRQRRLTVIHSGTAAGEWAPRALRNVEQGGRPDAAIVTPSHVVLVESELAPGPDVDQMTRIAASFDTPNEFETCTWSALAGAARGAVPSCSPRPAFVLQSFEEFLRMTGYGGLIDEHFSYFAWSAERQKGETLLKSAIRRNLSAILAELKTSLGSDWEPHIGNISAGAEGAWGRLAPGGKAGAPHISLALSANGLDIFANVETAPPFAQFQRSWKRDPQELVNVLAALGEQPAAALERSPWYWEVVRRVPKQGRPRQFHYFPFVRMPLASLMTRGDAFVRELVDHSLNLKTKGESAPEIKIGRFHPATDAVGASFGTTLAQDAQAMKPYFAWLGEGMH